MSYGLYIGKNLTADGIAYLAGYGDEPSSHWLEIEPRRRHRDGETITVGVTPQADLPGLLIEIPQVEETARHIRVSYSYYKGVPAPLTNGGLNEHGVAVRDIWSTSRAELIAMTPPTQTGPNYSDLARLVLERAHTAREGVELIGECLTFCALKESEDGQYLVLRCVNVGDATVAGRWRLPFDVHDTKLARLDETILTDLPSEGREVRFDAPPRAVVTLLVR